MKNLLVILFFTGAVYSQCNKDNWKEYYAIGRDMSDCDLRGANLRGAELEGADLRGAILYGADLEGANHYQVELLFI